jgi:hypothetical protein
LNSDSGDSRANRSTAGAPQEWEPLAGSLCEDGADSLNRAVDMN